MNKQGGGIDEIYSKIGFEGLLRADFGTRIFMGAIELSRTVRYLMVRRSDETLSCLDTKATIVAQ